MREPGQTPSDDVALGLSIIMHDYLKKLVTRMSDTRAPLGATAMRLFSRNRHFHTFATPLGVKALRLSRELNSLTRDIVAQARDGRPIRVELTDGQQQRVRVLLEMPLKMRRTAYLTREEFDLLLKNQEVRQAINGQYPAW